MNLKSTFVSNDFSPDFFGGVINENPVCPHPSSVCVVNHTTAHRPLLKHHTHFKLSRTAAQICVLRRLTVLTWEVSLYSRSMATTTTRNYLRLLIVIGGPCLLVLIFVCTCLITQRRARELGVLPRRHYSFYASGRVLPPPKSLGPISSRDPSAAGSRDNLIFSHPATCDSIHLSVPSVPTITIDTVKWGDEGWTYILKVNSIENN